MDLQLLDNLIAERKTQALKPVLRASYKLAPASDAELKKIALDVNKALGVHLFDDFYKMNLIRDFSLVARSLTINALDK